MRPQWLQNIYDFFNPKQRWLTKKIPNGWQDKDALIQLVLFECLVHYVEEEKGLPLVCYTLEELKSEPYWNHGELESRLAREQELFRAYVYIKHLRNIESNKCTAYTLDLIEEKDAECVQTIMKHYRTLWT